MFQKIIKQNKNISVLYFVFLVLFSAHRLVMAEIIKYNVSVVNNTISFGLQSLILWNLLALAYMTVSDQLSVIYEIKFVANAKAYLNKEAFKSLLYHGKNISASEGSRIFSNDIDIILDSYIQVIGNIVYYIASFIMGVVYLFSIKWIFTVFILLVSLTLFFLTKIVTTNLSKVSMNYLKSVSKITDSVNNLMKNIPLIRMFRMERKMEALFHQNNEKNIEIYSKSNIITKTTEIINDFGTWLILLGMYVLGIIMVKKSMVSMGDMFAAVEATSMITIPIMWISSIIASLEKSKETRLNFESFTSFEGKKQGKISLKGEIQSVRVKNLAIGHEENTVLEGLSFTLEKGDKVMIVGESGLGKSTLIKTLIGLICKKGGDIFMNEVNLEELTTDYLDHIAYVGQENFILHDTVLNNITMYSEYNKEKMQSAIKKAKLEEFVNKHGLEHILDENVSNISGGERQRINIARAFYHGGDVLILDEAFSALDPATSIEVQKNLLEEFPIVLSILHKYEEKMLIEYNKRLELVKDGVVLRRRSNDNG